MPPQQLRSGMCIFEQVCPLAIQRDNGKSLTSIVFRADNEGLPLPDWFPYMLGWSIREVRTFYAIPEETHKI